MISNRYILQREAVMVQAWMQEQFGQELKQN